VTPHEIIGRLGRLARRGGSSRLFGASVITVIGYVTSALIGILGIRIFTELAVPRVFGSANLILTMTTLATTLFVAPITNTQIRYHSETSGDDADRFTNQVTLSTLATTAGIAIATAIGWAIWTCAGSPPVGLFGLLAILLLLFVTTLRNVILNRLQAERRQGAYIASTVLESVLLTSGVALGVWIGGTTDAYVAGQAIGALSFLVILAVATHRIVRLRLELRPLDPDFTSRVWRYGAPFAPIGILTWLSNLADRYVLALVAGPAAVGRYAAPFAVANRGLGLVNSALSDVFRPVLFEAANTGDTRKARLVFWIWILARVASAVGILVFIALFGRLLAEILLAPQYREGAPQIMIWVAGAYSLYGTTQVLETRLMSLDKSSKLILPLIVGAAANVAFSLILIPRAGILGAAQSTAASFFLQFLATLAILILVARRQELVAHDLRMA